MKIFDIFQRLEAYRRSKQQQKLTGIQPDQDIQDPQSDYEQRDRIIMNAVKKRQMEIIREKQAEQNK